KNASNSYRDSCMAVNVNFISNHFAKDGLLLGAHNGHIQYEHHIGTRTTASYLKEYLKDEFYTIGVEFGHYSFRSLIWSASEKKYLMNFNTIPGYKKNSLGFA